MTTDDLKELMKSGDDWKDGDVARVALAVLPELLAVVEAGQEVVYSGGEEYYDITDLDIALDALDARMGEQG